MLPLLLLACQPPAARVGTTPSAPAAQADTAPVPTSAEPTADAAPATLSAEIVARHPHDPAAFTQGLQWVDGRLLESTGQVGESGVRWVTPETGEVEVHTATPNAEAFGEGSTWLNGQVYHITWQTGEAYRFDEALKLQETYRYQGEGWGLTQDGKSLIMSDGSASLFWRDPATFRVTDTVGVSDAGQPVPQLNELEWAEGSVWANVWMQDRIARIDPESGKVTGWLDASALAEEARQQAEKQGQPLTTDDVLNGIAYNPDSGHFYLTGKRWPLLFEVKVRGE